MLINEITLEDIDRFQEKINWLPNEKRCIEWIGCKNKRGYGNFSYRDKTYLSHCFAWMLINGNIPNALVVCHACDNPACINTLHLICSTQKENIQDAVNKGRIASIANKKHRSIVKPDSYPCGERHWQKKLTEQQVKEIRNTYTAYSKENGGRALAKKFGVSTAMISYIIDNKNWKI